MHRKLNEIVRAGGHRPAPNMMKQKSMTRIGTPPRKYPDRVKWPQLEEG